jgi:hypothetical protein
MLKQSNGTNNAMSAEADDIMSTTSIKERVSDDLFLLGLVEGISCLCLIGNFVEFVTWLSCSLLG